MRKQCPWCSEAIGLNQLGRRPALPKPKWFQFSRNVLVCPYCAGAVKLGGQSKWFLLLLLPSFISLLSELITGHALLDSENLRWVGWALFAAGFSGAYLFGQFEKVENL